MWRLLENGNAQCVCFGNMPNHCMDYWHPLPRTLYCVRGETAVLRLRASLLEGFALFIWSSLSYTLSHSLVWMAAVMALLIVEIA